MRRTNRRSACAFVGVVAHNGGQWKGFGIMPVRLFNLRNVPEDEANEVRQLLSDNGIAFYETQGSAWGISAPNLWLPDDTQLDQAQTLIDAYQHQRTERARAAYEQLRREGRAPTWIGNIIKHPLQFVLLVLLILFVLYVTLSPFLNFK
jgi:Family of unknown function (DUF6164)